MNSSVANTKKTPTMTAAAQVTVPAVLAIECLTASPLLIPPS